MTTPRNMPIPDIIKVANPAPGANWAFTNQDGGLMLIRSATFLFTTSAAVANRFVALAVQVDAANLLVAAPGLAQAASLAVPYSAYASASSTALSTAGVCIPWRDSGVLLRQGYSLATITAAIDVADQYNAIVLDVLRYLPENPYAAHPYLSGYAIQTGE